MKEEFLHFIWKNSLFERECFVTEDGEPVEILSPGRHNTHAGPDFFDARIRIGKTRWAGNVEIHLKASDWNKHGHQTDPQYNNTILHVVAENDCPVQNEAGTDIPAIEITWPRWIEYNYQDLMEQHNRIHCASRLNRIDPFRIRFFLNGMAIERLQHKIETVEAILAQSKGDWAESFYRLMARSLGFKQNGVPFELLAQSLPLAVLQKHHGSLFQLEALLFGQAGLLDQLLLPETYPASLIREYHYLARKYHLRPIQGHLWKFMRMHPLNFPTIRLAQLAGILHRTEAHFSVLFGLEGVADCRTVFKTPTSSFWNTHYSFAKASAEQKKCMGEDSFQLMLINAVVPFVFLYGERHSKQGLKDKALKIMEELPSENNTILRQWEHAGITAANALESQALIHLHHQYCENRRCLCCTIGQQLVMHVSL